MPRFLCCFSDPGLANADTSPGTKADFPYAAHEQPQQHLVAPCPEVPPPVKAPAGPHGDLTQMEHSQAAAPACPPSQAAPSWNSLLMEAIPFSLAVVNSEGMEVLHHIHGSEPAAAQALRQVLQQFGHPASAPAEGMQLAAVEASSKSACSFLALLLGLEMADDVLSRVHKGRSWKGSITMHLPRGLLSSSAQDSIPSGALVTSPVAATAGAAAAAAGLAGVDEVVTSKSAFDEAVPSKSSLSACEAKSILRQCSGLKSPEANESLGSLEGSLRRAHSCRGVRWRSLQTGPEASFPHGKDADLFMLSSDSRNPHELARPRDLGGLHIEVAAQTLPDVSSSVPTGMGVGGISAPSVTETCPAHLCGSLESFGRVSEIAGVTVEVPSLTTPRSKSCSSRRGSSHRRASRSSLLRTEKEIEQLMLGSGDVEITRTVAFLKSLSRQAESVDASSSQQFRLEGRDNSLPGGGHSSQDALGFSQQPPAPEVNHQCAPTWATPETLDDTQQELVLQSFDIFVTLLKPEERERSPQIVLISNSTQHLQVQATLSALAESQLELLSSIMPQHAIQFLALESTEAVPRHVAQLAHAHKGVTLLFMDIVGFTSMCKNVEPVEVMVFLNTLFSLFDRLTDIHGVHKVETAGDCYIVSGGIMSPRQSTKEFGLVVQDQDPTESAKRVMEFAKAMLDAAQQVKMPDTQGPVRVRVGMHTGDVVSGLIGSKLPKFSIFGDTMNTASRMESTGVPGRIHVSETTHRLLQHAERWESTGGVEVKGKGQMQTYLWVPPSDRPAVSQRVSLPSSESLQVVCLKRTCTLLQSMQLPTSCPLPLMDRLP